MTLVIKEEEVGNVPRLLPVPWWAVNMAQAVQKAVAKVPTLVGGTFIYHRRQLQ